MHGRSRSNIVVGCDKISRQPGHSFSVALGESQRKTVAQTLANKDLTASDLLESHVLATLDRIAQCEQELILLPTDTTSYDFTGHKKKKGLLPSQGTMLAIFQHNTLALSTSGIPLGLLSSHCWVRKGQGSEDFKKESDKWFLGLKAANLIAEKTSKKALLIADREADIAALFKAERKEGVHFLIRLCKMRDIKLLESGETKNYKDAAANLPFKGNKEVDIVRDNKPIKLKLEVSAGPVEVSSAQADGKKRYAVGGLNLIRALEVDAFDEDGKSYYRADDPAQWILLTSMSLDGIYDALDMAYFYSLRWRVERFHFLMKSGALQVEKLQFDDAHTTINAIAMYSVIAWRILQLTYWIRQQPEADAKTSFSEQELTMLSAAERKEVKTIGQAVKAMCKLVGFYPNKNRPWPGAKKIAEGLSSLSIMLKAIELTKNLSRQH